MRRIAIASVVVTALMTPLFVKAVTVVPNFTPFYGTEDNYYVELHGQKNLEPNYSLIREFSESGIPTQSLSYGAMSATGSVDVGTMKVSAATTGLTGGDTSYHAAAYVGYRDVVTFNSLTGASTVDLTYHFNIDGFHSATANEAYGNAEITVQLRGAKDSVTTAQPSMTYFRNGAEITAASEGMSQEQFNSWYVYPACYSEQNATTCRASNGYFDYPTEGTVDISSDVSFTVQAGKQYEVWVFFSVQAKTYGEDPSTWDFSHTATFAGLTAPPDVEVTSTFFGKLTPDSSGLLTYASTPAVPEPGNIALVLAGLAIVGLARKRLS